MTPGTPLTTLGNNNATGVDSRVYGIPGTPHGRPTRAHALSPKPVHDASGQIGRAHV